MARGEMVFRYQTALDAAYLGIVLCILVIHTDIVHGASSGNATLVQETAPPFPTSAANANEELPLLSSANLRTASKVVFGLTVSSFTYLVHLPKVIYLPIKHATAVLSYGINLVLRPLHPIYVPLSLAVQIIAAPVIVPVLLVYHFAVLLYPLYVFVGAAVICGAICGLTARGLGKVVLWGVLGPRSKAVVTSPKEKETRPSTRVRIRGTVT